MSIAAIEAEPTSAQPRPRDPRITAAPLREPPFDDERTARLSLVGRYDQPLPFRTEPAPSVRRLTHRVDEFDQQPTSRSDLPNPEVFIRRLLVAVIETGTGRRPPQQLAAHTSPAVHAGLARDAGRIHRLGTAARPATVHSLHLQEPADGVVEANAVLAVGRRYRAIALRLEGLDGRWRCVRLQLG
jgi:hypothetical protein